MIGLLPVKVPMTTKEQITLSRSGERAKTSGHFYGRFREFVGCRTRAVTGEWVKSDLFAAVTFVNAKKSLVSTVVSALC